MGEEIEKTHAKNSLKMYILVFFWREKEKFVIVAVVIQSKQRGFINKLPTSFCLNILI